MNYSKWAQQDSKYAALIRRNFNFEYQSAMSYYSKLKIAMLNQLATESQIEYMQTTIPRSIRDIENSIMQYAQQASTESTTSFQMAQADLEEIVKLLSTKQVSSSLKGAITKAVNKTKNNLTKEQNKYKNFERTFTGLVKQNLSAQGMNLLENLLRQTRFYSGASVIVQQNMKNFLLRNLINDSITRSKNPELAPLRIGLQSYARSIGGYYKEEAITKSINKLYEKASSFNTPTEPLVINVAGKNNPSDLLFNTIFNQKGVEQLCSESYQGEAIVSTSPALEAEMVAQSKLFGAQIKSWQLMDLNNHLIRDFFPIGYRQSLKNNLENNEEFLCGKSTAANMAFMGQRHNIITALGAHNVMFIAGGDVFWMDAFISEFRKNKLYLSLDTTGRKWDTITLTGHVSLLKYSRSVFQKMIKDLR